MTPAARLFTLLASSTLLALALHTPAAVAAGFDCSKARTLIEKSVCDTPTLSAKDDQLNALYKPLMTRRIYRELETRWVNEVRDRCQTATCLERAYDLQIRNLTALPPPPVPGLRDAVPLPQGSAYRTLQDEPWPRFALAAIPDMYPDSLAQLIDVGIKDGVRYALLYVANSSDGPGYNQDNWSVQPSSGVLLEYADNRPGLHVIDRDVRFAGWRISELMDQGERYAGIQDGAFYYRQRTEGELQQAMVYTLGSRQPPQATTTVFHAQSRTLRFAKARVLGNMNDENSDLRLNYEHALPRPASETVLAPESGGWSLSNLAWSERRQVLYFENSGAMACIWRVDLSGKVLSKIVPEHTAGQPLAVELDGREAIVYVEHDQLMFALSPDL